MPKKGYQWEKQRREVRRNKFLGSGNPFHGKKHSEETKKKISQARLGKWNGYGFKKGHLTWNKGLKGIHLSSMTEFKKGHKIWQMKSTRVGEKSRLQEKRAGRPRPANCEVCGKERRIFFDHDHKTGKFRGWICRECNSSIGFAGDNYETLLLLAEYLKKHERESL